MMNDSVSQRVELVKHGLIVGLIIAHLLVIPLSWILNVMGVEVRSMLSGESVRWCFMHVAVGFTSRLTQLVIMLAMMVGAMSASGLQQAVASCVKSMRYYLSGRKKVKPSSQGQFNASSRVQSNSLRLSYRERVAFYFTLGVFLLACVGLTLGVSSDDSLLRNSTGGLLYSPFSRGIVDFFFLLMVVLSWVYGVVSMRVQGMSQQLAILCEGLVRHASWIIIAALLSQLIAIVGFLVS